MSSSPWGLPQFLGGAPAARNLMRILGDADLTEVPIVAFAGRSNVGKSSLLNALTGAKVARVSSQPGRTQEINLFRWGPVILADLPGYGYARVAKDLRAQWGAEIPKFLRTVPLALVAALADGRHGYSEQDAELVRFLQAGNVPFVTVFTKMDKFKSSNQDRAARAQLTAAAKALNVERFLFVSAEKKRGLDELLSAMKQGQ